MANQNEGMSYFIAHKKVFKFHAQPQTGVYSSYVHVYQVDLKILYFGQTTLSLFYKLRKMFLGHSELRKGCILGFLVLISSRHCSLIQGGQIDLLSLLGHGSSA